MKKIFKILFFVAVASYIISSCDKVTPPFIDKNGGGDTAQIVKKILLEEFTGHKCVYCPTASKTAHDLKEIYGKQLVSVAMHAGTLAEPDGSGDFTANYTTTTGDDLYAHYLIDNF